MLLVAKMVGQLGMHRTLYKSTRQLLQQALFADQVLRSLVIRKQLVDDSFVDSHTSLLVLRNLPLHKILNTLALRGAGKKTAAWIGALEPCRCTRRPRPRQVRQHSGWPIPDLCCCPISPLPDSGQENNPEAYLPA